MIKSLLATLLLCGSILAQTTYQSGQYSDFGPAAANNAAQADFDARCAAPGVIFCDSLSGLGTPGAWSPYPVNPNLTPTVGVGFPIGIGGKSGTNDGVTSTYPDATTFTVNRSSVHLHESWNNGQANGGDLYFQPKPDSSVLYYPGSPSGSEFYVSFRERMSLNAWTLTGGENTAEGQKHWLQTCAPWWIDINNYMICPELSDWQFVGGDFKQLRAPVMYYGASQGGTQDGGQMNIFPVNSLGTLLQNAIGFTREKSISNQANNVVTDARDGAGNRTVTFSSTLGGGYVAGAWLGINGEPVWDRTVNTNVSGNGQFQIVSVNSGAKQVTVAQLGPAQSISPAGAIGYIIDKSHMWEYPHDEWFTTTYHVIQGLDYINNSHNYRRRATIELWQAREGRPYQLVTSVTDTDLVLHDSGSSSSAGNRYHGSPVTPASGWWGLEGVNQGADALIHMLQYWNYRCGLANVLSVSRAAGWAHLHYNTQSPGGITGAWGNGHGDTCPQPGDKVSVSGIAFDASFNGVFTACNVTTTGCTASPTGGDLYVQQVGLPDVPTTTAGATAGLIEDYAYDTNCNGGHCDVDQWRSEAVISTNLPSQPKACAGAAICGGVSGVVTVTAPDPATNLVVTAVNASTGEVDLQWKCNDPLATYKLFRATADKYVADYNQSTGGGWVTVLAAAPLGAAAACPARYGVQTFADTSALPGQQYSYLVVATSGGGDSTRSNAAMNTPGIPSDVVSTEIGPGNQLVTWSDNPPLVKTGANVQRCDGTAYPGSCPMTTNTGWVTPGSGTCAAFVAAPATTCTDGDTLTAGHTFVYRVQNVNAAGATLSSGMTAAGNTTYGGNTAAAQLTASSSAFLGLPSGSTGFFALGSAGYSVAPFMDTSLLSSPADNTSPTVSTPEGSANQCPIENFVNSATQGAAPAQKYPFNSVCKNTINAQSSGVLDFVDHIFYGFGGGHDDLSSNWIYLLNLTTNPVVLRRAKAPTTPLECGSFSSAHVCTCVDGTADCADPLYSFAGPSSINALPPDEDQSSFAIANISCVDSSHASITLSSPAPKFVVNTGTQKQWLTGKGWAVIAGTVNFNTTANQANSVTAAPDSTHLTIATSKCGSSPAAETVGTASYTWSSCIADPTTGLGCAPNAIHSTQSLAFMQHPTDPTKNAMLVYSGSAASGPGNTTQNSESTIGTFGGINDSTPWVLNHMKSNYSGFSNTNASFEDYVQQNLVNGLAIEADHGANTVLAYDLYGTVGAANKVYNITPAGFTVGSQSSADIWYNNPSSKAASTQELFFVVGGCWQVQVISTHAVSGVVTYTLNGSPSTGLNYGSSNGKWGFYGTGFDKWGLTSFSTTTGTNPTVTDSGGTGTGDTTGGMGTWCPATGSGPGQNALSTGIFVADVSNGASATTQQDWTNATFDPLNVDLNNSALGNTCAEAFSGGHYVSSTPWVGPLEGSKDAGGHFLANPGISPGFTFYDGPTIAGVISTGDFGIWPNEGQYFYAATVDLANHRLQCRRTFFASTGTGHGAGTCTGSFLNADVPCNTSNNSGFPNSTWGTWHRLFYDKQADVWVLINAPDQPARILRLH